ncbi:MAG TPA: ribonuclease HI [Bacteroidia bacterium]|nr:ribonuclease HI [Bacteroidia bacterium]HNT79668.1 ribonuclease HI [Bacteroidia bacterium]
MIYIYTDGAASGNPGPGGYGIILQSGENYKEISEGFRRTTNNRMELLAVIVALESLKKEMLTVTVVSDSKYVIDAVQKGWLFGWEKIHFKKKKNEDLWRRFLAAYRKHKVLFKWIKGHNQHPQNERCDELAVAASQSQKLLIDQGYESGMYN